MSQFCLIKRSKSTVQSLIKRVTQYRFRGRSHVPSHTPLIINPSLSLVVSLGCREQTSKATAAKTAQNTRSALHMQLTFWPFLCSSLKNNNVKWSNCRFCEEREHTKVNFPYSISHHPYKFSFNPVKLDKLNKLEQLQRSLK